MNKRQIRSLVFAISFVMTAFAPYFALVGLFFCLMDGIEND